MVIFSVGRSKTFWLMFTEYLRKTHHKLQYNRQLCRHNKQIFHIALVKVHFWASEEWLTSGCPFLPGSPLGKNSFFNYLISNSVMFTTCPFVILVGVYQIWWKFHRGLKPTFSISFLFCFVFVLGNISFILIIFYTAMIYIKSKISGDSHPLILSFFNV